MLMLMLMSLVVLLPLSVAMLRGREGKVASRVPTTSMLKHKKKRRRRRAIAPQKRERRSSKQARRRERQGTSLESREGGRQDYCPH